MRQLDSSIIDLSRKVCFAYATEPDDNIKSESYIRSIYGKVCHAYAAEFDEYGESFISRLQKERAEIGKIKASSRHITEAEKQFLIHDCVFISAERSADNGGTDASNKNNTNLLRQDLQILKEQGLLEFYDSEGIYKEINSKEKRQEIGFFCTDVGPQMAAIFFIKLFELSQYYYQDSFLYKSAGGRLSRAGYLIATNEAAFNHTDFKDGYYKAGDLYFNRKEGYCSKSKKAFGDDNRVFFTCENT